MTTKIEIQTDVAERLMTTAKIHGVSIDTLLRRILKRMNKTDESIQDWQLGGSIELLDEDLEKGNRQIAEKLQKSLLETARNL